MTKLLTNDQREQLVNLLKGLSEDLDTVREERMGSKLNQFVIIKAHTASGNEHCDAALSILHGEYTMLGRIETALKFASVDEAFSYIRKHDLDAGEGYHFCAIPYGQHLMAVEEATKGAKEIILRRLGEDVAETYLQMESA